MTELLKNSDAIEVRVDDLRVNLADYIGQVRYADRVIVVKKHNRDAAIILSPRMFERILKSGKATREDRAEAIKRLEAIRSKIPDDIDPDQLQKGINRAVKEVRAEKRKKKA